MAENTENTENVAGGEVEGGGQVEKPEEVSQDARTWAMLCHLLGLFTSFIGPLIIWLIKKQEDSFIDNQGKEAMNFQITLAIAWVVSLVLIVTVILACIGLPFLLAIGVVDVVFAIVATVKANGGEAYRYPVSIRFIK